MQQEEEINRSKTPMNPEPTEFSNKGGFHSFIFRCLRTYPFNLSAFQKISKKVRFPQAPKKTEAQTKIKINQYLLRE